MVLPRFPHEIDERPERFVGSGLVRGQQQFLAGDRGVRDGAHQLGIIGQPALPVGFRPAPVEYELAVGIEFKVERSAAEQPVAPIPADDVPRQPARVPADAAMPFQGAQEFVAEKRIAGGHKRVPLGCGNFVKSIEPLDTHGGRMGRWGPG